MTSKLWVKSDFLFIFKQVLANKPHFLAKGKTEVTLYHFKNIQR